ncbi:MAG: D-TA family PLP-dependent enzyme [Candidatus Latescibacteria bacterium]|nr:D-TA family PLP-dependent enzyme [Candidatus Latescibacterota bacterium]
MTIHDLDTPALTIDLDILEKNIRETQEDCNTHNIHLRVHTKTHKIPEIAHMQLQAGAIGIVCQKVGEAEAMVAGGISDILIPYNIVGPLKVKRLTELCKRAKMTVAVDSEITAKGLSDGAKENGVTINMLVECDSGGGRCGVQSPEAALELAQKIIGLPGLQFEGIMTFPSNERAKPFLDQTRKLFAQANVPLHTISGGGTGTAEVSKTIGCTETRIGSYVFEGLTRISHEKNPPNPITCAERMITTIVSTPTSDRIIIDGGQKAFTSYAPTPYGYIMEYPKAKIYAMSVEHGLVNVSECDHTFTVGDRLSVIPLHQGMTTNLHDEVYAVRNDQVEHVWKVAGRGKVR